MICIRSNLAKETFNVHNSEKIKLVNFVIEICKRNNLGKWEPSQRICYLEEELDILKKITEFVLWIYKNECRNFRTLKETEELIKTLIVALRENKPILIFNLFCPGYKKGKEVYGFNEHIGNTTKRGIANLSAILKKAKSLGIPCYAQAIYSDLALENFSKLTKKDLEDLKINFENFKSYGEKINSEIEFLLLSQIENCNEKIGFEGITSGEVLLDENEILRITKRSYPFYRDILGWKEKDIVTRTEDLARSCAMMAQEIKKQNNLLIKVMSENMYERGKFYQGSFENKNLPIFYPKKLAI